MISLGVTPQTIIFSTGESTYTNEDLRQLRDWPRHRSLRNVPRSISSLDHLRHGSSRSASGSSTVEALRRRLASGNGSSSSLHSDPPSQRTSINMVRPVLPNSPPSVASRMTETDEASSDASGPGHSHMEDISKSSATIKQPSSIAGVSTSTRARSKVNSTGVEIPKVHATIGPDMTTATGQLTLESQADHSSVSGVSESDRQFGAGRSRAEQRFSTTYGKRLQHEVNFSVTKLTSTQRGMI